MSNINDQREIITKIITYEFGKIINSYQSIERGDNSNQKVKALFWIQNDLYEGVFYFGVSNQDIYYNIIKLKSRPYALL